MNKEQQEMFYRAVTQAVIDRGTPVTTGDATYGWPADDYAELRIHMAHCRPEHAKCSWDDSEWTEFQGTFDPDVHCTGIDAIVTCACGTVQQCRWRYTEGYAALLRTITEA